MTHRSTLRDAPALCALFGAIFAAAAIMATYGWRLDVVDAQDLQTFEGRVERVTHTDLPKAGLKIHIFVRDGMLTRHFTQDDPRYYVQALNTLQSGDSVVALAKRDSMGRDLYWLWELRRGGDTVLSYDQTLQVLLRKAERVRPFAYPSAAIAAVLFVAAFILRRRFGAWRAPSAT